VKPIPKTTLEYWALIAEIVGAIAVTRGSCGLIVRESQGQTSEVGDDCD
jgi:hypothetical protein